jgi:uncharacterized protein (DUF1499 family)
LTRLGGKALAGLAAAAIGFIGVRSWAAGAARPATLGLGDGRLAPCPETPNCISSERPGARLEPWRFTGPPERARAGLLAAIAHQPRARLITVQTEYIHAEFRSAVFGFVDDVEFRIDVASGVIHFRSASRLGRSDFGTNRRRIAALGAAFQNGSTGLRD